MTSHFSTVMEASDQRAQPGHGMRLLSERNYPQARTTPGTARDDAARIADGLTDPETLKLCVSELVTNSITHADPGHITVLLWHMYHEGLLRCEVIDAGGPTTPGVCCDPDAIHRRGLFLVEQIAIHWSYYRDHAGLTTWCTLPAVKTPIGGETADAATREA